MYQGCLVILCLEYRCRFYPVYIQDARTNNSRCLVVFAWMKCKWLHDVYQGIKELGMFGNI